MVKDIVASGPVIVEEGRLIVTKDSKDDFYKIPGGQVEKDESLKQVALREFKEETGLECKLGKKLSTMKLEKESDSGKINIELHHYKAKLKNKPKSFKSYNYEGHEVSWFYINEIKEGFYNVAPNIKFLIERGDIK